MFPTVLNYHWDNWDILRVVTSAVHIKHQQVPLKWKWLSVRRVFCIFVFHESHRASINPPPPIHLLSNHTHLYQFYGFGLFHFSINLWNYVSFTKLVKFFEKGIFPSSAQHTIIQPQKNAHIQPCLCGFETKIPKFKWSSFLFQWGTQIKRHAYNVNQCRHF
jgi:hypothetical protein